MHFVERTLEDLTIDDDRSLAHVGVYGELKRVLVRDRVSFLVPGSAAPSRTWTWDRVLLLNLTRADARVPADVLSGDHVPADVVCHAAWHHLARRALAEGARSPHGLFLAESIASAFDVYLVGRALGHTLESDLLETQVPAMAERAEAAGVARAAFEEVLQSVAADPERAFEDLRQLLFDAAIGLFEAGSVEQASVTLCALDDRRFSELLHHFDLSTWVLRARACGDGAAFSSVALGVDAALRDARVSLEWLEREWLAP